MHLTITGKCKNVKRDIIKRAVAFYADYLDITKNKVDLWLDFECNLQKKQGDEAYCVNEGGGKYTITVDSTFSKRKILIALAHEMVHIKQYVKRELTYNERKKVSRYRGQVYKDANMNYWDMPWEIEAFGRELGLYRQFIESDCKRK